jgi:hypothetical protein
MADGTDSCLVTAAAAAAHRHLVSCYVAERLHAPCRAPTDMLTLRFNDGAVDIHRILLATHSEFLRYQYDYDYDKIPV